MNITMQRRKRIMKDFKEGYRDMLRAWENASKKNKSKEKKSYWNSENE